jgi:hypothetical protein
LVSCRGTTRVSGGAFFQAEYRETQIADASGLTGGSR